METVLPVAHATFVIKLDGLAGQLPFAARDRGSHGINTASSDFAVHTTPVEPFLGHIGGDGHDLEL